MSSVVALQTPELVYGIFKHVSPSDLTRLCQVSRSFFLHASPILWRNLKGISKLLKVIPGTKFTPIQRLHPISRKLCDTRENTIDLPKTLNMSRFNYYAPLVQVLDVFGDAGAPYRLGSGWENLESHHAARPDGLCPNLLSLVSLNTCGHQIARDWIRLLSFFTSPRLEAIKLSHGGIISTPDDPHSAIRLTSVIFACFSQLHTLHVLLGDHNSQLFRLWDWSRLDNLRHLAIRLNVINDPNTLLAVSRLPYLTRLELHFTQYTTGSPFHPITLPDSAFPALVALDIECTHPTMVEAVWRVTPMIRPITRIRVKIRYYTRSAYAIQGSYPWVDSTVQNICLNSPSIRHLELDFRGQFDTDVHITRASVGALETIPLKSIELAGIRLAKGISISELAFSLSGVEDLKLPSHGVKYTDLYEIAAHLPRLRNLFIGLDNCHNPFRSKDLVPLSYIPIVVKSDRWPFGRQKSRKFLEQTVQFLHAIWPNVQFAPHERQDEVNIKLLNRAIGRLRH
ncbi:hypothetical protein FRC08_013847 [Ceratobasidium sp. 394]|nr:hypothetical protein FRC08_013847 [Ceratobasidium sp. 394]KAG9096505.1 hypothetical protein FS749_008350 [Ceratobasidium sp. UAMH 11750]